MKRFIPLFTILCMAGALIAQPINDDCTTATSIGPSNLDDGTMSGDCVPLTNQSYTDATPWEVSPGLFFTGNCWGGAIDSVVFYSFVAQGVSGSVDVTNGPATSHVAVLHFTSNCDVTGATEVGCTVGGTIDFDNDLIIGQTYYVVVGFENSVFGNFDICVFNPVPAVNDECAGAISLGNLDGCNSNMNNYYPSSENIVPSCFPAGEFQSVWYSFVAQGVSIAELYANGSANAHIAVWDFSGGTNCALGTGVILACATDVTSTDPIVLDNDLTIGNTYYIEVVFDNNTTGSFDLCLDNPTPAFNDDCNNAEPYPQNFLNDSTDCHTSLGGNTLNNDWPSSDIGQTYGCWNTGDSYNVWFSFVAQGPDLDVTLDALSFAAVEQIAVIEFTGSACNPASWVIWGCANGAEIDINNTLEIGHTYYVTVGFANNGVGDYCINIFNPEPPENDTMCAAIPITGCAPGQPTTIYANPEFNPNSFPGPCQTVVVNTVWYTLNLQDPNNVGFSLDFQSLGITGDISLVLFEEPDCNVPGTFSIAFFYCGPPPSDVVEWGPINENSTYYLMVGTSEAGQGDFSLCVTEIPPCFNNNYCLDPNGMSSAFEMGTPETQSLGDCAGGGGPSFICVEGCNQFADPEPGLTGCLGATDPVVWYTFQTDGSANILNMTITSEEMDAPSVQLFFVDNTADPCGSLINIGLTPNNFSCMIGSNGLLVANSTPVSASSTYYIAVGGVNTLGGDFEICIGTIEATAPCVTDAEVEIVSRSNGGPIEGPYYPGEVLNVCMNVNNFQVATGVQNCQWFQGLVPVFGDGWDLASFDGNGQPLNAELNGNAFPAPNVENGGTWDWWTNIMYHHVHCFYNVGDFDGNGTLDMCNGLYDIDCTGPGLAGGCCGPCWSSTGPEDPGVGSPLPPGWFTSGVNGTCGGLVGWPAVDWGDGNTCNGPTGPWHFCFDLTIQSYPDCEETDLSIGFVTFADGEVGSWFGNSSVCGEDEPVFQVLPLCCTADLEYLDDVHDPFCSGGVFSWLLDHPNATFWEWTVEASSSVIGGSNGNGPPGTVVVDNLTNNGTDMETVIYHFLGFDGGDCPSVIWDVSVDIFPPIMVTIDPFTVCGTPTTPYTISPEVDGGDPSSYSYEWHDGSTGPTFEVDMPVQGQQYCLTVTDAVGCSGVKCVTLDVYTTFPVVIDAPITDQCLVDGPIDLSAEATGGTGTFTYNWTGPSGQILSGPDISADESGQWLVVAEDSDGCRGKDSVTITFHLSPEVSIFPEDVAVCPDNPIGVQIQALVIGGQNPYLFEWTTPGGVVTTPFILVDEAGDFGITVTDAFGCTTELQFEVLEHESPTPQFPNYDPYCPDDLDLGVVIDVPFDPDYVYYAWNNGGPQGPNETTITVTEPGYYRVTVTNIFGCKGTAEVEIEEFLPPLFDMPDTIPFCAGNFIIVDATDGWISDEPFDPHYQWDGQGVGGDDPEQFIFFEGLYFLTVTDDNGCTAQSEFYALPQDLITVDIIGDSVICNGVPATIIANPGFDTYEWSTGETTSSIDVVVGNQFYYVIVSDGDGCFGVDSVYVPESAPAPGIQGENVCEGDAATLDVGNWNGILWSTAETTSTISTDTTGTFYVTVTDQFGCTNTADYTVTVASKPIPDIQGALGICAGTTTTLDAGGVFSSYAWSTGETTPSIIVSTTGTVWVMVTNPEGCEASDTVAVTVNSVPVPNITGDTSICNNVNIQLDAGTGYALYQWSIPGSNQTLDVSAPGTYSVTVTDANGCTGVDQIAVIATAPAPAINGAIDVCQGGSEILTATAGFINYVWTGGGTNPTLSVNTSGTYIVTVTDQYGCQGTAAHTFVVNPNPVPVIDGSSTFCPGSDTDLDAGAGYSTYAWTGGSSGQVLNVNTTGTYGVTVTDGNGCTGTASISVSESNELIINPPDRTICAGDVATLSVGNFDAYVWSTSATTPTIDVTMPGTYFVTVTDAGCTGTADIVVTVNQTPSANVAPTASACNSAANGSTINFSSLITGGDSGGTWVDVDNSGATGSFPVLNFDGVAYGTYTFQYTTNSALAPCQEVSYLVEIAIGTSPELSAAPDLCNDNDQLNLSTLIVPGTPPGGTWTIVGTPPGSNPASVVGSIFNTTNADPGTYTVQYQISGIPGSCPDSDTQTITVNPQPDAGFASAAEQVCVGDDELVDLSLLLQGADGGGTWIETSSTPSTGGAFSGAAGTFGTNSQIPGTYTFEYILNGTDPCPDASTTVEVIIENVPQADAGTDGMLTCDVTSIVLGGSGTSTGPEFMYLWTTTNGVIANPTAKNPAVTNAGTYTLTVMNTLTGCENSDEVVVALVGDVPTDLNLNVYSPDCIGDPAGSAQVMGVTGGTPPYSYSLNGAPATATPNWPNLPEGDYTLLVTDDLGCKYETQFMIGTPNDLAGELTGELLIESGDNAILSYALTAGVADSIVWFIDGTPTCVNCDTLVFTPIGQTQVQLTIYDPRKCEINLFVNIQVHVTRNVYIPNIFSPNGDGVNDFFTIFASNTVIANIDYLEVFSRWGDKVFERKDFAPAVEELGWDGMFKGEVMMPGVYVFSARVRYADDVEEIFKGDLTLIR